ncbi:hypothetical protein Dimus_005448 [Dionaea muscipula]
MCGGGVARAAVNWWRGGCLLAGWARAAAGRDSVLRGGCEGWTAAMEVDCPGGGVVLSSWWRRGHRLGGRAARMEAAPR